MQTNPGAGWVVPPSVCICLQIGEDFRVWFKASYCTARADPSSHNTGHVPYIAPDIGGTFPRPLVVSLVTGAEPGLTAAHGPSEMPVWGPVFRFLDPSDVRVQQRVNGEVLQDSRTSYLIFDIPTLVAYVTRFITLEPGDLILTGTPEGVGVFREPKVALKSGDVVEIEIEGIGVLRNEVTA